MIEILIVNGKTGEDIILQGVPDDTAPDVSNDFTMESWPANSNPVLTATNDYQDAIFRGDMLGPYRVKHYWRTEDQWGEISDGTQYFDIELAAGSVITQEHTVKTLTAPCGQVGITVTTNVPFNNINGVVVPGDTLTYDLYKGRQEDLSITVVATDAANGSNTLINTKRYAEMATVLMEVVNMDVKLTLEGDSFQYIQYDFTESGVFKWENEHHYDTPGPKNITARDLFGCTQSFVANVSELLPIDPDDYPSNFYISKANPLRFVLQEELALCGNYKNDENTFGCEVDYVNLKYSDKQRVKKCWNITNQFKSSYNDHTATLHDAETDDAVGGNIPITLVKKNIKALDSRLYYHWEDDTYSFVYFDEFGTIPTFYRPGGIVTIGSEDRMILKIVYKEAVDIWVIQTLKFTLFDSSYMEYTYNKQDYDVFQFDLESMTLPVGEYYILLNGVRTTAPGENNPENKSIYYKSLPVLIDTEFEREIDIMYWNDTNNDIYWASGIKGIITVALDYRKAVNDHQNEIVKTDNTSYLRKSFGVEKFEFLFEPMTQEIATKIKYALSQYYVSLNGTLYVFDNIEMETIGEDCNDYTIKATGTKTNKNINFISYLEKFDWSSSNIKFDNSITFDATVKPTIGLNSRNKS